MITSKSRFLDMTTDPSEYTNGTYSAASETLVTAPVRKTLPRSPANLAPADPFRFFQYVLLAYVFI